MKCYQCHNLAMFTVNQYPLCLHCSTTLKQADTDRLKTLHYIVEQNEQFMEYMAGFSPAPKAKPLMDSANVTLNNINVSNSNIGMINTGEIYARTIDLAISSLKGDNQAELANALKKMTEAVCNNQELDNVNREKLMEMLRYIAEKSIKPAQYRKKHFTADIIEKITQCASVVESIKIIWDCTYPILKNFFA